LRTSPPALGADGEAVLAEFGFSGAEIERLRVDRVLG
jgi:crotonobetainyl-CoA:carnitine CoA-transferase CaiB-like acyl-CoA transferase